MDEIIEDIDKALDKKKEKNLYLKRQQIKLKKAIESGMLNPEQQYGMIEGVIDDLLLSKNVSENMVEAFENHINSYMKQLEQLQIEISEEYKKAYERILEL